MRFVSGGVCRLCADHHRAVNVGEDRIFPFRRGNHGNDGPVRHTGNQRLSVHEEYGVPRAFCFGLVQRPRDAGLLVRGESDAAVSKALQRVRGKLYLPVFTQAAFQNRCKRR